MLTKHNPQSALTHGKVTGTTLARSQLTACLAYVRDGETVVVTKLDRLARSLSDLCAMTARLERQ